MPLSSYLFFTTMCEEALAFYAHCGSGEVAPMTRYGAEGMPTPRRLDLVRRPRTIEWLTECNPRLYR